MKNYIVENCIKQQTVILESFLYEFCKVNGIEESELKNHLCVGTCFKDHSVMAINANDLRDVKFGIKIISNEGHPSFEIFGEYLGCEDNYPETKNLIYSIKNGGNTGNTATTSGK